MPPRSAHRSPQRVRRPPGIGRRRPRCGPDAGEDRARRATPDSRTGIQADRSSRRMISGSRSAALRGGAAMRLLLLAPRRYLQNAPPQLVALHADEQRAEIALTESVIAAPLDDLEENGTDQCLGEYLQQEATLGAVQQDAALLDLRDVRTVPGHALFQHLVIRLRRGRHELHAIGVEPIPGREGSVRAQRDVLNALAAILLDELLDLVDLIAPILGLRLVNGNADLAARRSERAAGEAGVFAGDVEVLVLVKVEHAMVEALE